VPSRFQARSRSLSATQDLGGNAGGKGARRHLESRAHEGHGRDHGGFADDGAVHDRCIHAHQRIPADPAAMQDGAMADMAVFFDHRIGAGKAMHDAAILDVGAALQDQSAEIAAQRSARPDITAGADDDVADQHGRGVDEGLRMNHRNDAVDGIDLGHGCLAEK
jgi:hypothetical protein